MSFFARGSGDRRAGDRRGLGWNSKRTDLLVSIDDLSVSFVFVPLFFLSLPNIDAPVLTGDEDIKISWVRASARPKGTTCVNFVSSRETNLVVAVRQIGGPRRLAYEPIICGRIARPGRRSVMAEPGRFGSRARFRVCVCVFCRENVFVFEGMGV